jgi:tetratricopeptide (TPR) repeat protein
MRKLTFILGVSALALLATSCQKLKSRDQLNKGVQAFKNAQYAEAVEKFKVAVELDPNFPTARLYLATAYMQQYIPGAESPENNRMAQAAHDEFMKVLEQTPNDKVRSLRSLPSTSTRRSGMKPKSGTRSWPPSTRTAPFPTTASGSSPGRSGTRSTARPAPTSA